MLSVCVCTCGSLNAPYQAKSVKLSSPAARLQHIHRREKQNKRRSSDLIRSDVNVWSSSSVDQLLGELKHALWLDEGELLGTAEDGEQTKHIGALASQELAIL